MTKCMKQIVCMILARALVKALKCFIKIFGCFKKVYSLTVLSFLIIFMNRQTVHFFKMAGLHNRIPTEFTLQIF